MVRARTKFIYVAKCCVFWTVFRIRKFVGLPDPDPSIIKQKYNENINFNCLVILCAFLSLKNDVNVSSKNTRNKQKNF
jgi:hypothetical protein